MRYSLINVFVCLPIISSTVSAQLFVAHIPAGYFARSNLSDCHQRFHNRTLMDQCLVFGGVRANVTEFPHMAVIGWATSGTHIAWKCGGSLITTRFVVTAAHCAVDEDNNAPSVVRVGDVNLASDEDDKYAQQVSIARFIRHPQHRFSSKYDDIALIELDQEVNLTLGVCPACVWHNSHLPYDNFDVAGFGATGYAEKGSPYLLKAYLKMETTEKCTEEFAATRGLPNGITEKQLCASNTKMDTCQGDSGGPLQITLNSYNRQIPTLIGVTSFGRSCGFGSFGVYQKIHPHIMWIESIVGESLDLLECAKKYEQFRVDHQLEPECKIAGPFVNRVELHWEHGQHNPQCAGTLIDYNTVITSASCTTNSAGNEPHYISILGYTVPISEINRFPDYTPGVLKHNIALIRLKFYLKPNLKVAPACPISGFDGGGIGSLKIARNDSISNKEPLFLPIRQKCDDKSFSSLHLADDTSGNDMDCYISNYRLIPGLCNIDEGGPFLNHGHSSLQGINILPGDCGSQNPLVVLKLDSYIPWIESFVLDRSVTPEPPISFPEDNSTLFFKPCHTRDGTEGVCLSHWGCGAEIVKQKHNGTGVTMCGFEGDVGYICCPQGSIGTVPLLISRPIELPLIEIDTINPLEP
ncbi:polyserase-2-like [Armigeres subalbatus]|uniref:polyserase-2-like n=1 Tax=Armigeres subalbatus TaxID=124917 RepID=UPI002ED5A468